MAKLLATVIVLVPAFRVVIAVLVVTLVSNLMPDAWTSSPLLKEEAVLVNVTALGALDFVAIIRKRPIASVPESVTCCTVMAPVTELPIVNEEVVEMLFNYASLTCICSVFTAPSPIV